MKRAHFTAISGSLCALFLGALGCKSDDSCTAASCQAGTFELIEGDWSPGEYELEVSYSKLGDQAFVCPLQIAANGDADAGTSPYQSTCKQTKGRERALFFYLGPNVPTLHLHDDADTFELTIRRAGQVVFEDTIAPDYDTLYPNGEDCGSCRSASMRIDISPNRDGSPIDAGGEPHESLVGCRGPLDPGCAVCKRDDQTYLSGRDEDSDRYNASSDQASCAPDCPACATCSYLQEALLRELGERPDCEPCTGDAGIDPCFAPSGCGCWCIRHAILSSACPAL